MEAIMRKGRKKSGRCLAALVRVHVRPRRRGRSVGKPMAILLIRKQRGRHTPGCLYACLPACGSGRAETAFISASHDPSRFRLKRGRLGSPRSSSRFYFALPGERASERASGEACLVVAVVSLVPRAHTNSEIRAISTQLPPDLVCRKMHSSDDDRPTAAAEA